MQTAYDLLNVKPSAGDDEIRQAYLLRVRLVHPDRHAGADAQLRAAAETEFRRVQDAYELIRTAQRRQAYDAQLWGTSTSGPGPTQGGPGDRPSATTNVRSESTSPACEMCGRGPAERFKFMSVIGALLYWQMKTVDRRLCRDCALFVGREMQSKTLTWGWFGFLSLIFTPFLIVGNANALGRANRMPNPVNTSTSSGRRVVSTPVGDRPGAWLGSAVAASAIGIAILIGVGQVPASTASQRTTTTTQRTITTRPAPPTTYAPIYPWEVGNCTSLPNTAGRIYPVACDVPNSGFIFAEAPTPDSCPLPRTESTVSKDGGGVFCVDRR